MITTENIDKHLQNLGIKETDFEKGLGNSLNKETTSMKFKKKGSEIKEKLLCLKEQYIGIKDGYLQEIISLRASISTPPTELIPDYFLRDIKLNKDNLPKIFPWSMINPADQDSTGDRMRRHNDLVENYVNIMVELVFVDTLSANLQEDREYELDTEQLVNLGF